MLGFFCFCFWLYHEIAPASHINVNVTPCLFKNIHGTRCVPVGLWKKMTENCHTIVCNFRSCLDSRRRPRLLKDILVYTARFYFYPVLRACASSCTNLLVIDGIPLFTAWESICTRVHVKVTHSYRFIENRYGVHKYVFALLKISMSPQQSDIAANINIPVASNVV